MIDNAETYLDSGSPVACHQGSGLEYQHEHLATTHNLKTKWDKFAFVLNYSAPKWAFFDPP